MKRKHILIVVILFAINCISCKKYLEIKSDSALSVPTTIDDLQAMLDNTNNMNFSTPGYGDASADDYFLLDAAFNARGEKDRNAYIWLASISTFDTDWSRSYLAVYYANICIEQIEKIKKSDFNAVDWNNVKGSSLFFRSYYFLQLVWTYAKAFDLATASNDLGIILRLGSDPNELSVRASVKQCYEQIINDTKVSIQFLPNSPSVGTRPSKASAYGLLARTYLTMRQYDSALIYANLSLNINSQLIDYNNASDVNIGGAVPFKELNRETLFYTKISTGYAGINPSVGLVDSNLYILYNSNDLRRTAFFRSTGLYRSFKGSYTANAFTLFSGITTAEMFLTRAECYARAGNKDAALADLNSLMIKRWRNTVPFPPITAADANDAINKILIERRKELLFRGLRWIDIKRLNKEGKNIILKRLPGGQTYTLSPNDDRYALALPIDIIQITGVPQNSGW